MSEEEKKAIKTFNNYINAIETFGTIDPKCCNNLYEPAIALLNLIQKQQAELEKKDKIIDEMIKVIIDSAICDYFIRQNCKHYAGENKKTCDICILEYFTKKVEEDK